MGSGAFHELVESLHVAYGEETTRQVRELRYYQNQAAAVDRLLAEKDKILTLLDGLKDPLSPKNGEAACRSFYYHVEALFRQRLKPHVEEISRMISGAQAGAGSRNRMSWEAARTALQSMVTLGETYLKELSALYRPIVPDLPVEGDPSKAAAKPFTVQTSSSAKQTFEQALATEAIDSVSAQPYDDALVDMEEQLAGLRLEKPASLQERLAGGVGAWIRGAQTGPAPRYQTISKNGYVSLEGYRQIADCFERATQAFRVAFDRFGDGQLRKVTLNLVAANGASVTRPALWSRLFRNLAAHGSLIKSIDRDQTVETAYRLYFRPAWDHYRELCALVESGFLFRLAPREKLTPEVRALQHHLTDIRSHLDHLQAVLKGRM